MKKLDISFETPDVESEDDGAGEEEGVESEAPTSEDECVDECENEPGHDNMSRPSETSEGVHGTVPLNPQTVTEPVNHGNEGVDTLLLREQPPVEVQQEKVAMDGSSSTLESKGIYVSKVSKNNSFLYAKKISSNKYTPPRKSKNILYIISIHHPGNLRYPTTV